MPVMEIIKIPIKAITFQELVEHGRKKKAKLVNGMPWSFKYGGESITHENDQCYLIPTPKGTMKFTPDDMLITAVGGGLYPYNRALFVEIFEVA